MNYTDENRGSIQLRERARQLNDFHDIKYGAITPTDIDGYIEYHNEAFIFYEVKYRDAQLPRGQEIALVRLVDACWKAGYKAALIICEHNVDDPETDVPANMMKVRCVYLGPDYGYCAGNIKNRTPKQMTDGFLKWNPPAAS